MFRHLLAFALLPVISSCVAPRSPAPAPAPRPAAAAPAPAPRPAPAPSVPSRYQGEWSSVDIGPEEWRYARENGVSYARLMAPRGDGQAAGADLARIGCQPAGISLSRPMADPPRSGTTLVNIRTSFGERAIPHRSETSGDRIIIMLDARDPLWDQIMFSRGRFVIEVPGLAPLIAPTHSDLSRVIEDCRR